ncbi:MAG: hypothetical protein EB127_21630 [Alphaproteobacteria bacterium]|nr:hypothetical protein [Alphaproteobacteria bacterium]
MEIILKASKQTRNNKAYVNLPSSQLQEFLKDIPDGKELVVEISLKRTLSQNRLLHKIINIVADYMGESFEATKAYIVCKFFGCTETTIDDRVYTVPVSTSKLNKKEFAQGLTNLYIWAEENNIKLPSNADNQV